MEFFANRLTKLDTLEYTFEEHDMTHLENENKTEINLDVSKLKSLQMVDLDIDEIYRTDFNYVLLRVSYPECGDKLHQYYCVYTNPQHTFQDYFTKKEYIINPTDADFFNYLAKEKSIKTLTINLKINYHLKKIGVNYRQRRLTDDLVLKPITYITHRITNLMLADMLADLKLVVIDTK